ncbi:MAG: PIN domain-containing protein [Kiritimatiellia bacterium]|nr:PIN domain-containing protein [Kiritimatiellia bacterium]
MSFLIYLDYNCFQRGFDDQRQSRIRIEAAACERLFLDAEAEKIELIWSFMHADENEACPFTERKQEIKRLSSLCSVRVGPSEEIREMAKRLQSDTGVSAKDALHLACALKAKASVFITCDDDIINKAGDKIGLSVKNPIEYIYKGKQYEKHQ